MHRHNSEFTFEARHEPSFVCQGMNVHLLIWPPSHFLFRHESGKDGKSGKGQFMRSHSALLHRRTMLVILNFEVLLHPRTLLQLWSLRLQRQNVVRVVDGTDVIKFLSLQNWWSGWEMWNVWCADAALDLFLRIFGRTPAHTNLHLHRQKMLHHWMALYHVLEASLSLSSKAKQSKNYFWCSLAPVASKLSAVLHNLATATTNCRPKLKKG